MQMIITNLSYSNSNSGVFYYEGESNINGINKWKMHWLYTFLILCISHIIFTTGYCPVRCVCTGIVTNCSDAYLPTIPEIDPVMEVLDFSYNEIVSTDISQNLPNLRQLNLSHCGLTEISLDNVPNLEIIDLSYNNLKNAKNINVSSLKNLKFLNLSNNKIFGVFGGILNPSLEILDLSSCSIMAFKEDALSTTPKIKELILHKHSLRSINHIHSKTLNYLDLSFGEISAITAESLMRFPKLKQIDVSHNRNLRLYFPSTECIHIEKIILSYSALSDIVLNPFCDLEEIDFSENAISILEEDTFNENIKLKKMNLSVNNIESIHKNTFSKLTKLKSLDLTRNMLRDVLWTNPLLQLMFLNLSKNQIQDLSEIHLQNVVFLDVSENRIFSLNINFEDTMPNLEFINLSFNLISLISPMKSTALQTLKINYCQISYLDQIVFSGLQKLKYLELEGNKLARLDYKVFANVKSLQDVRLLNNPWYCNCKNDRFHALYTFLAINSSITNANELLCDGPGGKTWLETCTKDWRQSKLELMPFFWMVSVFFLGAMGLALICYCKNRRSKTGTEENQFPTDMEDISMNQSAIRRVHSYDEVTRRTISQDTAESLPPPTYEEALLLPPLSEIERMTRSMDVLLERNCNPP